MAGCSVMAQILGEHSHFLAVVTNRCSYLQVEEMINVGPLLVLKSTIKSCFKDFEVFFT